MNIRQASTEDVDKIVEIYNWYILNTAITFETEPISSIEMKRRIQEKLSKYNWIVGQVDREIVGYAYYDSFRSRAAYHHTVESTIYLTPGCMGKGFGKTLYLQLIESAKEQGFREMVGVITLPNLPSTALHQKLGFQEVGVFKSIGYKFGQYVDIGMWQKSLFAVA